MKNNFRLNVSILSAILVFLSFTFFFIIEYFFWLSLFKDQLDFNFYIGRVFISISFSFLSGLCIYIYANNFYESLRTLAHKIQVWGNTLEPPAESGVHLKLDPEIIEIEKYLLKAIESSQQKEKENLIRSLEKNNASIVENLKPFLKEIQLEGLDYLDVSVFPKTTNNLDYDFLDVIETEQGYILFLMGFEKTEILESIYKHKLTGITSTLGSLYNAKESEILIALEKILEENLYPNLRISLQFIPNTANHLDSLHFQKMPILEISDSGITIIRSDEINLPMNRKLKFHKSIFTSKSYLILISDKTQEALKISVNELIAVLEKEVFSKPIYSNSKELLYQISLLIEQLALQKNIKGILEMFYCIVVNKK